MQFQVIPVLIMEVLGGQVVGNLASNHKLLPQGLSPTSGNAEYLSQYDPGC